MKWFWPVVAILVFSMLIIIVCDMTHEGRIPAKSTSTEYSGGFIDRVDETIYIESDAYDEGIEVVSVEIAEVNELSDSIVWVEHDVDDFLLQISEADYDIVIDLNDIHIEIDYDPNENVFVCTGAYNANAARQAITEVLTTEGLHTEYTLRVLVVGLCRAFCDYDDETISDMLTASFVFDDPNQ